LRLNPAGSTTVWCNASIRDLNGINDVVALRGVFWSGEKSNETDANDPAKHYTATYSNITPEANTRGYGTVAFAVASSAVSGLWYCKITAVDAANLTGYNTTTAMVFPVSCDNIILDAGEELIDCGGICPACFNTTPVNASGVRGKTVNASGWINYMANQPSKIVYAGA